MTTPATQQQNDDLDNRRLAAPQETPPPPRVVCASTKTTPIIKKFSLFERNVAKPVIDSIVEVLDLELDVKLDGEDENEQRKTTSTHKETELSKYSQIIKYIRKIQITNILLV